MTIEFTVPDATCGHCKATIESTAGAVAGVESARFDLDTKRLTVEGSANEADLKSAVQGAGYTPEPV